MDRKRIKTTKSERVAKELDSLARSLGSGERLPSVRQLCQNMNISLATLNAAMRTLETRGVIERRHGSGVYVTDNIHVARVAIVANAAFFLAGGSPVWGMMLGEVLRAVKNLGLDAAIYLAQPDDRGGLAQQLPTDFEHAVDQGRVDGVVAIGLEPELIRVIESRGLKSVSYAGPGSLNFRVNINSMAKQLAQGYALIGKKSAMIVGCHHRAHWSEIAQSVSDGGLKVTPFEESHWDEQGLLKRMARPYLHLGQDFAPEFERIVQVGNGPDVLFLMDDIFAQGFLMMWRNSPHCSQVTLACHSNRELRMFMGWEGELGLMEVEVLTLTQLLAQGIKILISHPKGTGKEWVSELKNLSKGVPMELITENDRNIVRLEWNASKFNGSTAFAK